MRVNGILLVSSFCGDCSVARYFDRFLGHDVCLWCQRSLGSPVF